MTAGAVSKVQDFEGIHASGFHAARKNWGPSNIPRGLTKSPNRRASFDSMKDLRKFLRNCCCVPAN